MRFNESIALKIATLPSCNATDYEAAPRRPFVGISSAGKRFRCDAGSLHEWVDTEVEAWHWLERIEPEWQTILAKALYVNNAVVLARGRIALECPDQRVFDRRRKTVLAANKDLLHRAFMVGIASAGFSLASAVALGKTSSLDWNIPTKASANIDGLGLLYLQGYPSLFTAEDGIEDWDFSWVVPRIPVDEVERIKPITRAMTAAIYADPALKVRYANVRELWCAT